MFDKIGEKIKKVVTIITVVLFIAYGIAGISLLANDVTEPIWVILGMGICCLFTWIGMLSWYALGEIAERVASIDETLKDINRNQN